MMDLRIKNLEDRSAHIFITSGTMRIVSFGDGRLVRENSCLKHNQMQEPDGKENDGSSLRLQWTVAAGKRARG